MSISLNNYNLTLPRGDSAEIAVTPYIEGSDEPYILSEGERIVFTVETLDRRQAVIEKSSSEQDETGAVSFSLSPEDTDLPRGSYCWSAKLIGAEGELIDTFIGGVSPAAFYVK